jgi:preprotein translocase subunit SecG
MAFGGGAADALFGAGSGSALTKLTKYSATAFFVLVFLLSVLKVHASRSTGSNLREQIEKTQQSVPVQPAASPTAPVKTGATTNSSPAGNLLIPIQTTNSSPAPVVPAAPMATNPAAGPGK